MNLETKVLEIRDSMTYIAVLAICMTSEDPLQRYHLRRVGFSGNGQMRTVVLMRIGDQKATSDVYEWPAITGGTRTMRVAHDWIEKNFDSLKDGHVVDVQYILGETTTKKTSEFYTTSH